ncbi:MAG: alpha/beta hydrolase [Pseudonocardiaceae bacterium]|nr:alpha/beta hydrolase [Pseudonocardiaceae bacterium]
MSRSDKGAKRVAEALSRPGPHEVLRGDLALVGLPGVVFSPRRGLGLPAVAFGHGWLQPTRRYDELLRHLASWGIVAACPGTQTGLLSSQRQYAADLRTTLDVCSGVRLGDGEVSVNPGKLGLAGHSMGGGCAVLAAADESRCRAVATLALTETLPSAVAAAKRCDVPALHLAAGKDRIAPPVGHAEPVAQAWAGPVQLRTLPKASHLGFTHGRHWSDLLLDGSPEGATRRTSRALLTAFLLHHLAGSSEHDALLDGDLPGAARQQLAGEGQPTG